ncbi:translation initiation factor 2 [Rhodoplanes elegans]|nr:translation initiation factor 2 [Rhodoplanes elegans]
MLAALMCAGCATMVRGTDEQVRFVSEPEGALARLSNGLSCVTPCEMPLPRKFEFSVTFEKSGFEPQTIAVKSEVGAGGAVAGAGNIIVGGVIGALADGNSGAMLDHTPNPVAARLVPAQRSAPVTPHSPVRPPRSPTS